MAKRKLLETELGIGDIDQLIVILNDNTRYKLDINDFSYSTITEIEELIMEQLEGVDNDDY